jgi:pimeloyl-ACP methyl ester carboxylesterase
LLGGGGADRFQKLCYGRKLARDLGAEIDVIEEGKHFVPEDHPDRVAVAIRSVIKEATA